MKALRLNATGGDFELVDLPRPVPGRGEVLVRIHASGLNPLDAKIRAGAAPHARHPLPAVLGIDLAGTVEAVGLGVTTLEPGEEVYGMTGGVGGLQGSLAEYAAVDAALLARKPANLTMREAAGLPLVAITAWQGLMDRAKLAAGQTVLVQAGAGGVGHLAVQIARAQGAVVFATHRGGHDAVLRTLGATPIDIRQVDVEAYVAEHTGGMGFDIVYDTLGDEILDASFRAVRQFGQVVSALGWGTHSLAPLSFRDGTYSGVFTLAPLLTGLGRAHHGAILARVAQLTEAGQITPRLDPRRFDLATVAAAHDALSEGSAGGKLVVSIF